MAFNKDLVSANFGLGNFPDVEHARWAVSIDYRSLHLERLMPQLYLSGRSLGRIGSDRSTEPLKKLSKTAKDPVVLKALSKALKDIDGAALNMKMDMDSLMQEMAPSR